MYLFDLSLSVPGLPFSVTALLLLLPPVSLPPLPSLVLGWATPPPCAWSDAVKPGQATEDCCGAVYSSQGGRRGSVGGEGGGREREECGCSTD